MCQQLKEFLSVRMFASCLWGRSHCVSGQLTSARVYSKVDYVFGSVWLTITKSFCFRENSTRKPMCLLSLCRVWESASFTPIAKPRKSFFDGAGKHREYRQKQEKERKAHKECMLHFTLVFTTFLSETATLNIFALVDGPGASHYWYQTSQTSCHMKKKE